MLLYQVTPTACLVTIATTGPGITILEVVKALFDGENSALLSSVMASRTSPIILTLDNLEHQRFLVCLTYHMVKWKAVAETLCSDLRNEIDRIEYNCPRKVHEQAFEMVRQWIATSQNNATLDNLFHSLRQNNHEIKVVSKTEENRVQHLLPLVGQRELGSEFMCIVAKMFALAWTTLGRLLGMTAREVYCTLEDHCNKKVTEQALRMLVEWCRQSESANYATFVKALCLLLALDAGNARDAWECTLDHMSRLAFNTLTVS